MQKLSVEQAIQIRLEMLFLIFFILKLTGNINWSWLWVLAPLWIPLAILAAVFISALILGGGEKEQ